MLNQVAAAEAMYSATYVENYLDSVENLPNDVQRHLTRIREIDLQYRAHLRDVDYFYDQWSNCSTNELETTNATSKRTRAMARIQQSLIAAQELGDEKLQVVTQLQEMIDLKTRQLDGDFKNLDYGAKDDPALIDPLPKETRPVSPASFVPSTTAANQKSNDSRIEESAAATAAAVTSSSNNDRVNIATAPSAGANTNSSNASNNNNNNNNNNGDRSWKRSRRARNEIAASRGTNSNNFSNASKTSQLDLTADSTTSTTSQSKTNATTSAQQSTGGTVSNVTQNKKQSSNSGAGGGGGGSGASKKRKRKSGRAQSVTGSGASGSNNSGNGNQNNARSHDDTPPLEETIDPDEPTYCLCDQISFGEMILCDNDLCPIEWFHFSCVSLTTKPKGKWFCPNCRGDRPSVMKPKQQFLKELERYNREKEEKT